MRIAFGLLLIVAAAKGVRAQVELRSGQTLTDPIIKITIEGVETAPALAGGATRTIAWDLIREVKGDHAAEVASFADLADQTWRARARLARNDIGLAEPMLAALFEQLKAGTGPTTLLVADGLMRCRLARADQTGAIEPWLVALRLQGADAGSPPDSTATGPLASPAIDPETGLAPALPPIWLNNESTRVLAGRTHAAPGGSPIAAELERLYLRAARLEAGLAPGDEGPVAGSESDPTGRNAPKALPLVRAIVDSRSRDEKTRRSAREQLESGLAADLNTWREAWRRAALGRSLLMEADATLRAEGVFQLIHLPARFSRTQPYLAGIAVTEAAAELKQRGKAEATAAAKLLDELRATEPLHPALRTGTGGGP